MAEIIVALDVPFATEAERLLERLPGLRWVKVGSILMTRAGPGFVRGLVDRGLDVFLDLKWHDIPNTVAGAVSAARELGVSMATVHALGGPAMMRAAATAADGALALVGVTVLTSHSAGEYDRATGREGTDLAREVDRLGRAALDAGLDGVVCSPQETARVRALAGPGALIVVPGIRRAGDVAGDQTRTADPATAAASGATHLVVGRPILAAPDPEAAYAELAASAGGAPPGAVR
jgi:orotidine-5'-phosphate decarboxylase